MEFLKPRLTIAAYLVVLFFVFFSARLLYLQIYKGEEYRSFSEENILRELELPAPRGRIFDRNGEKILYNKPSFNILVFPREITDAGKLANQLAEVVNVPEQELLKELDKAVKLRSFHPVTIVKDISREELLLVERNKEALKGVFLEIGYKRFYPHGEAAAVLLGHTGSADAEEVRTFSWVKAGDIIGKSGIEKIFDSELKGKNGLEYVMVNAYGKTISNSVNTLLPTRNNREMVYGEDIQLTIDAQLQKVAYDALGEQKGAIVAMDVRSGEILTMVSRPSYLPEHALNKPSAGEKAKKKGSFSFLNRSTQGTYPPGSVFKIITSYAFLEEEIANTESSVYCPGYYMINKKRFNCWRKKGHGHMNIHRAIVESCDVFFYKLSLKLGVDGLYPYLKKFGLGEKTGIGLPERRGVSPSKAWKKKHLKEPWYLGETVILAIGQGYLTTTPLQISLMTSAVANGGIILKPKIRKTDEEELSNTTDPARRLDKKSVSLIQKALYGAVNEDRATGIYARSKITSISGKTGTAQVVSLENKSTEKRFQDHAWFTSYAPSDSAEISVTVLVENGGEGSIAAAPIAKKNH